MDQRHPSERRLAEYWFEVLAPEEQIEVSLHLLSCENCRRSLDALPLEALDPQELRTARGEEVEAVLESALSAARLHVSTTTSGGRDEMLRNVQQSREQVDVLLSELADLPVEDRRSVVQADGRFHDPQLIDSLIVQSRDLAGEAPDRALESALLAVEIAQQLDAQGLGGPANADHLAQAWAYAGNAQRVLTDFSEASKAFAHAERWLARGLGLPSTRAQVLSLKASLLRTKRQYREAADILLEVLALYRQLGDVRAEGQTLVLYAKVQYFVGELDAAIKTLHEADRCLKTGEADRLDYNLHHNLVLFLIEAGRLDEAARRLPYVWELNERFGNPSDRLSLLWNEARLDRDLGRTQLAIETMARVRQGFIENSNGYDAALVSLDLAAMLFAEGRTTETRQLVSEVLPLLNARDVAPGVLAAMNLLLRSIEAENANRGLLERIRSQLTPPAR